MATATVYSHITKDPEVCGGKACVDGTRIRVLDLVCLMRQGLSAQAMLGAYPSLSLAQVYAALSYYHENPQEIDADLERDREAADRIEADRSDFFEPVVAGRPALFTDACVNGHLVDALVQRAWDVMRAIDVYPEKTPDPVVFERAAQEGRVFVSNDEGILKVAAAWIEEGRAFRMIFWPQEDYRAWTIGELVKAFEELAAQDDPFRYPVFRLRPRR